MGWRGQDARDRARRVADRHLRRTLPFRQRYDWFWGAVLFALVASVVLLLVERVRAGDLVRVIDGDTIELAGERVRLEGIDAPETKQTCRDARGRRWACGTSAAHHLEHLIAGRPVACRGATADAYGRRLATCSVGSRNLNRQMVLDGQAWAFAKYSTTYVEEERLARAAQRGVFGAENVPPWTYREQGWADAAQGAPTIDGRVCPIKGNVSSGVRIYHMPWQATYTRTRIEVTDGERWFCDEAQAIRAGWRPAGSRQGEQPSRE